jgi:hypothetical protein
MVGRWGAGARFFTNAGCLASIGKLPAPALSSGILDGIFGTVPFGRNPVLTI